MKRKLSIEVIIGLVVIDIGYCCECLDCGIISRRFRVVGKMKLKMVFIMIEFYICLLFLLVWIEI